MKSKWEEKPLGEVMQLEYGKPLSDGKRSPNGKYPVYGANGEKDRTNEHYYDKPSIIVGRKGSAGEVNLTENKFWPLDVTYFVTFDESKYNLKFLYNLLLTLELPKLAKGVKPGINRNEVYRISVKIPPLAVQKRIVGILDEAFTLIDKAKENAEKNLQNVRELFESYLKNIFANPGKDWKDKKLGEVCENLDSKRIPVTKRNRKQGRYPYYGASGIVDYVDSFIFNEELLLVSEDGANLLARTYPIAFSVSGKIWVNNHAHVLRFKNRSTQKYLEYYLNSISLNEYVGGMAQPKLNQSMLNSIVIPLPSVHEQASIVTSCDKLCEETKKLEIIYQQKLSDLAELRKSILLKVFNGELTGAKQ